MKLDCHEDDEDNDGNTDNTKCPENMVNAGIREISKTVSGDLDDFTDENVFSGSKKQSSDAERIWYSNYEYENGDRREV